MITKENGRWVDSNWNFERSSGDGGYRCPKCATWVYCKHDMICECNKKEVEEAKNKEFEDMKWHVEKLNDMLKDPQFGLSSWCQFYAEHMKAISDYWVNN